MYYSSFGILALILLYIINYDVLIKNRNRDERLMEKPYRQFLIGITVYYVSDILWGTLYEWRIIPLAYADTVLYFGSMAVSVLLWTRYVITYLHENTLFSKILSFSGWVILIYEDISLVINFFDPILFRFDEDKVYQPAGFRYITLAIQVLLFFAVSVYSLIVAARTQGKTRAHHRTVGLSGLTMTVFIVLQVLDPFLPYYAIGCMLGTCILHTFLLEDEKEEKKRELEELLNKEKRQREELEQAKQMAYTDSLTGVKNKHAYLEAEDRVDDRINTGELKDFGVVVFDLNDLKKINDTKGHEAGDAYIREACSIICKKFKHSPVYRIGGDEFVAFLEGEDYNNRDSLLYGFEQTVEENLKKGLVVISSGLEDYDEDKDHSFQAVFDRADKKMYERKQLLKDMEVGI